MAAILFYKKVVPLNFGFDSMGNEQNFLSNQKTGKLMNVTRNKLFRHEVLLSHCQFILLYNFGLAVLTFVLLFL